MRRTSAILLLFALVAVTCDLGGACAMALSQDGGMEDAAIEDAATRDVATHAASEACCCCPGACDAPCMEDDDEAPQPPQRAATLDGPTALAVLAGPSATVAAPAPCRATGPAPVADPSAGTGPALYLLACSFLN